MLQEMCDGNTYIQSYRKNIMVVSAGLEPPAPFGIIWCQGAVLTPWKNMMAFMHHSKQQKHAQLDEWIKAGPRWSSSFIFVRNDRRETLDD